jgi:hypothetical protein
MFAEGLLGKALDDDLGGAPGAARFLFAGIAAGHEVARLV